MKGGWTPGCIEWLHSRGFGHEEDVAAAKVARTAETTSTPETAAARTMEASVDAKASGAVAEAKSLGVPFATATEAEGAGATAKTSRASAEEKGLDVPLSTTTSRASSPHV